MSSHSPEYGEDRSVSRLGLSRMGKLSKAFSFHSLFWRRWLSWSFSRRIGLARQLVQRCARRLLRILLENVPRPDSL